MKVTVSFSETKVVVPCGDGTMLIRELAEMAVCRFRKSSGSTFSKPRRLSLSHEVETPRMPLMKPKGFAEPDTLTGSLVTDEVSTPDHDASSLSSYSDECVVLHAIGEVAARQTRHRQPTATLFVVEALMLARDGGILDWDDQVCDVLDDRELLIAKVKWDFPDHSKSHSFGNSGVATLPRTASVLSASQAVPCNGDLEDFDLGSPSVTPQLHHRAPPVPDTWSSTSPAGSLNPPQRTNAPAPPNYVQRTPSPSSTDYTTAKSESLQEQQDSQEMGNQPPAPPPHRNAANLSDRDDIKLDSSTATSTSQAGSTTVVAKSPFPIGSLSRRPAPPPPVTMTTMVTTPTSTGHTRSPPPPPPPPPPPILSAKESGSSALANGTIAETAKFDSIDSRQKRKRPLFRMHRKSFY